MKIAGVDPSTLCAEVLLVLPRSDTQVVFRARGLSDMEEFEAKCPLPKPPRKMTRDGYVANPEDPTYQQMVSEYGKKRLGYMVVRSLAPSNIEWDTVNSEDPRTWVNWEKDLKNSGFTQIEVQRITALVLEANALDEAKLAKAREVFLLGQAPVPPESSGPATEPANSPSGEPVNG